MRNFGILPRCGRKTQIPVFRHEQGTTSPVSRSSSRRGSAQAQGLMAECQTFISEAVKYSPEHLQDAAALRNWCWSGSRG